MSTPPADAPAPPPPLPLLELSDGVPVPVTGTVALQRAIDRLVAGTGPLLVDAERASGYRYGQRCYLVQLRRAGAGTVLVDPIPFPDLRPLGDALVGVEWVLHAASQDLPCLREIGLAPVRLFDTELAARLAGFERVGLATMVELVLGRRLDKGASSADWSQRPLSEPMLRYAALDVEPLAELRDHLDAVLREQGKREWAEQEFQAVLDSPPAEARIEPWRRTSGLHRIRGGAGLAAVRALWEARDELARARDVAPGRVLSDAAIVEAAAKLPTTSAELSALAGFGGRGARRHLDRWLRALTSAAALPPEELPAAVGAGDGGPPPAHRWAERDPIAAARLAKARAAVTAIAAIHALPTENLVEPALVRRLAWTPPTSLDSESITHALQAGGARPWQVELVARPLADALRAGESAPRP